MPKDKVIPKPVVNDLIVSHYEWVNGIKTPIYSASKKSRIAVKK